MAPQRPNRKPRSPRSPSSPPNTRRHHQERRHTSSSSTTSSRSPSARPSGRVQTRRPSPRDRNDHRGRRTTQRHVAVARAWAIDFQSRADLAVLTADDVPAPTRDGERPVWTEQPRFVEQLDGERNGAGAPSWSEILAAAIADMQGSGAEEQPPEWVAELDALMAQLRDRDAQEHEDSDDAQDGQPPAVCGICMEDITRASRARGAVTTLPCGHDFDTPCINDWATRELAARRSAGCPFCRRVFLPREELPARVVDGLLGFEVRDVLRALLSFWHRRRNTYWRAGADAATLLYIDDCWLRHRADWLAQVGNGRGLYEAVAWMLGRPPRNADLLCLVKEWEEAVEAEMARNPLAVPSVDRGFVEAFIEQYLVLLPAVKSELRRHRYI